MVGNPKAFGLAQGGRRAAYIEAMLSTPWTPYAVWMARHSLVHRRAAEILGISESTSWQYAAGINRTTGKPIDIPAPVRKLMAAYDAGVELKLPPPDHWRLEKTA